MANRDNAFGFRPQIRSAEGGHIHTVKRKKLVGTATAIYPGDVVARDADGSVSRTLTPGTTLISGVSMTWGKTLTATEHLICNLPSQIYHIQSDGTTVEIDMGLNANCVLGTGSATLKQSRDEINAATQEVTATLDCHLLDKVNSSDNAWGEHVVLEVIFNKHRLAQNVVGV